LKFHELSIHNDVMDGIDAMNYMNTTPIQEMAIPLILEGKDLLACAQTGTGKTAAFLIPILSKIREEGGENLSTLILVPTRELAKQIDEQIEGLGYFVGVTSLAIYGGGKGENWDQQRTALTDGANIIIATPGRLMAHMQSGKIKFGGISRLILDEADKMLDMGFSDDIMYILKHLPEKRQNLMFSATMPPKIRTFAKKILTDPAEVSLSVSKPAEKIDQQFYMASEEQKLPLLVALLQPYIGQKIIIFTSQRVMINKIIRELQRKKIASKGVSSDIEQDEREAALRDFKAGKFDVLVATDVLSRGIDISNLNLVVNFDIPRDAEDYIHRIGRTARADTEGVSITLVGEKDKRIIKAIEGLLEKEVSIKKVTEELGLGASPEFRASSNSKPKGNFKKKKFFKKKEAGSKP
jgi:ATP-dependent RNA helicase RhlE